MWAYEGFFYQIYPLGMTGAPFENDGVLNHRIKKIEKWLPHLKKLGVTAVLFNPLFDSDTHGYNTRDYRKLDPRLGDNKDFKSLVKKLHKNGQKVILDGVFNHVGRGFFGFKDVLEKREHSPYLSWFNINLSGNDAWNDGLWYEGWEGNYDLVKLNLSNEEVVNYLLESVRFWIEEFDIDGLRLDVAYCLDQNFIRRLRSFCDSLKEDFFLTGEMIGGDYRRIMGDGLCHSATNYECYKGLYSSMNSYNLFEITHSLLRQFGPENWTLYKGEHLLSFLDNHDVTRLASVLTRREHILPAYTLMFGMPGIPIVYYGSEWGINGNKSEGDPALRPAIEEPSWNEITDHLSKLAAAYKDCKPLFYGDFKAPVLQNKYCVWERDYERERVFVACNIGDEPVRAYFDAGKGELTDIITCKKCSMDGGLEIPPLTAYILR